MNKNLNYDKIKSLLLPKTGNLIKGFLMLGEFSLVEVRIIQDEETKKEIKIYQDDNLHLLVENSNLCLFNLEIFYHPLSGKNNLLVSWRDSQNKKLSHIVVEKVNQLTEKQVNRFLLAYPDNQ